MNIIVCCNLSERAFFLLIIITKSDAYKELNKFHLSEIAQQSAVIQLDKQIFCLN